MKDHQAFLKVHFEKKLTRKAVLDRIRLSQKHTFVFFVLWVCFFFPRISRADSEKQMISTRAREFFTCDVAWDFTLMRKITFAWSGVLGLVHPRWQVSRYLHGPIKRLEPTLSSRTWDFTLIRKITFAWSGVLGLVHPRWQVSRYLHGPIKRLEPSLSGLWDCIKRAISSGTFHFLVLSGRRGGRKQSSKEDFRVSNFEMLNFF